MKKRPYRQSLRNRSNRFSKCYYRKNSRNVSYEKRLVILLRIPKVSLWQLGQHSEFIRTKFPKKDHSNVTKSPDSVSGCEARRCCAKQLLTAFHRYCRQQLSSLLLSKKFHWMILPFFTWKMCRVETRINFGKKSADDPNNNLSAGEFIVQYNPNGIQSRMLF